MTQNESLQKLEAIVNDASSDSANYDRLNESLEKRSDKIAIKDSGLVLEQAERIHGDNQEAVFSTWLAGTRDFDLNKKTRKHYWDTYYSLSGDPKLAKESLASKTRGDIKALSSTFEKESYIRDNMNRWPEWLEKEYEPTLANFMIMNQSKDMLKGELAYKNSTLDRINMVLEGAGLDPDISEDDHAADFEKFTTLDLLDGAMVSNGRLGITNIEGQFEPAWSITGKSKVIDTPLNESPAVSAFLRDSVQTGIKDLVSVHVSEARQKLSAQNEELSSSVLYEMRQGNIPIQRWGDMAALTENPNLSSVENLGFLFTEGLKGEIDKNPNTSGKQINELVNIVVDKYAHLIHGGAKRG